MSLCSIVFYSPVLVADDDFYDEYEDGGYDDLSFDEFATVDSEDVDMNTDSVSIDYGKTPVDVKHFDIAGVMLGMDYDEVYNLFFNRSGLYAPRKRNSVIYTINKEWKYNLDYECRQNLLSR